MPGNFEKTLMFLLVHIHDELQRILTATQGVVEDISSLNKYTESLWEAMKLVWINELIDEATGR